MARTDLNQTTTANAKARANRPTPAQALKSAAHLIATIYDPETGPNVNDLDPEVMDSVDTLRRALDALGLLEDYKGEAGGLRIW